MIKFFNKAILVLICVCCHLENTMAQNTDLSVFTVNRPNETIASVSHKIHISRDTLKKYNPQYKWDILYTPLPISTKIYYPNNRKSVITNINPSYNIKSITSYEASKGASPSYRISSKLEISYDELDEPKTWKRKVFDKGNLCRSEEIVKKWNKFSHLERTYGPDNISEISEIIADEKGKIGVMLDKENTEDRIYGCVFVYDDLGILMRKVLLWCNRDNPLFDRLANFKTYEDWLDFVEDPNNRITLNGFYIDYNKNGDYYLTEADIASDFDEDGNKYISHVTDTGKVLKNDAVINYYDTNKPKSNNLTSIGNQFPVLTNIPIQWIGLFSNHEKKEEYLDPKIFSISYVYDSQYRIIEKEIKRLGKPFQKTIYEYWK